MELQSCRRRMWIPGLASASHPVSAGLAQDLPVKGPERDNDLKKTVTLAPRSRYLTGQSQYVVRKPLFTSSSHISILKKAPLQEHSEQKVEPEQGSSDLDGHWDMESSLLAGQTTDRYDACPASASYLSYSTEDVSVPLSTLDLRSWSSHEDTSVVTGFQANLLNHDRLPSLPLDGHSFIEQRSPKLDSTHHSSTSSLASRSNRVEHRLVQIGDIPLNPRSSLAENKPRPLSFHKMSPFQANYWACTIPTSSLPSPDRKSPSWDPDREYETLLDYTYPLRPNYTALGPPNSRSLSGTNPLLLDSGIELDCMCSFSSPSCSAHMDRPMGERRRGLKTTEQLSPAPKEGLHSQRYGGRLFGGAHSSADSLLEASRPGACGTPGQRQSIFASGSSASLFVPTWRVLPASRMARDSEGEEFRALPGQLQELQELSVHLQALSAQVCWSQRGGCCASLATELFSEQAAGALGQGEEAGPTGAGPGEEAGLAGEGQGEEAGPVQEWQGEEVGPVQEGQSEEAGSVEEGKPSSGSPHSQGICEQEEEGLQARPHQLSGPGAETGAGPSCVGPLDRLAPDRGSLLPLQGTVANQEELKTRESLMRHIQDFCANLEQLIVWLYKVVERMDRLTPPTVEIESVKASLADYQSFQRELSSQQPLTTAVLDKGGVLLRCLDNTSPVLKETLRLIRKQSRALEAHADHLFSSILSAMDCLTDPSSSDTEVQVQDERAGSWSWPEELQV